MLWGGASPAGAAYLLPPDPEEGLVLVARPDGFRELGDGLRLVALGFVLALEFKCRDSVDHRDEETQATGIRAPDNSGPLLTG